MISSWLRNLLIGVVTCVWAVNITAPLFVRDYKPPPEMHVAFMAILGLLTAGNTKPPVPPVRKGEKDQER